MLTVLAIVYAIVCILLVIVVMLQSGKAGNMGLFGGGGTSSIGSQSGDIMTRITTVLGVVFFVLALTFAFLVAEDTTVSKLDQIERAKSGGFLAPGEAMEIESNVVTNNAQGIPDLGGVPQP